MLRIGQQWLNSTVRDGKWTCQVLRSIMHPQEWHAKSSQKFIKHPIKTGNSAWPLLEWSSALEGSEAKHGSKFRRSLRGPVAGPTWDHLTEIGLGTLLLKSCEPLRWTWRGPKCSGNKKKTTRDSKQRTVEGLDLPKEKTAWKMRWVLLHLNHSEPLCALQPALSFSRCCGVMKRKLLWPWTGKLVSGSCIV